MVLNILLMHNFIVSYHIPYNFKGRHLYLSWKDGGCMDAKTSYFFRKYYRNIIKWWFVSYNPEFKRIWPSKEEEEQALLEEENLRNEEKQIDMETDMSEDVSIGNDDIDDDAFNAATGSYSGLYGKGPIDSSTKSALDEILNKSSSQNSIDKMFDNNSEPEIPLKKNVNDVVLPPEQEDIINEANAIYERLMREAAEDEARKAAEIEAAKQVAIAAGL